MHEKEQSQQISSSQGKEYAAQPLFMLLERYIVGGRGEGTQSIAIDAIAVESGQYHVLNPSVQKCGSAVQSRYNIWKDLTIGASVNLVQTIANDVQQIRNRLSPCQLL